MANYIIFFLCHVCRFILSESSDIPRPNCTCFDPEVSILLNNAHTFMEAQQANTFITYLNERNDTQYTRQQIHKYFLSSFRLIYSLFDNIKDEHFWDTSCKLRWPIGWYLGHCASFYNNKLRMNNILDHKDNKLYAEYDYLFAQGTDEFDWVDFCPLYPADRWPNVEKVKRYVRDTKHFVSNLILAAPLTSLPITNKDAIWWTILMGIEHERIHLETSAILIRQLPLNKCKSEINSVWSQTYEGYQDGNKNIPPLNELIPIQGREITYGKASDEILSDSENDFFGWDAEYGSFLVNVTDFNVSKYMVSNYEYYDFYQDGGYANRDYWDDISWKWRQETNTTYPKFWVKSNQEATEFRLRNTFTEIDMRYAWNFPVITNHYEADAFIRWKSQQLGKNLRLITEDEWNILRLLPSGLEFATSNIREWNDEYEEFIANINFYYYASEAPVNIFEFGNSTIFDVVGNVWHHTASQFHPFNGYEVHPLYVDFTTPFFNSSYYLMKGGSYLSSGNMAMITNRCQWFRAHYFQAAGIRYVESKTYSQIDANQAKPTTESYFRNTDESNANVYENIDWLYSLNERDNNYRYIVVDIIHKYAFDAPQAEARKLVSNIRNVLDISCAIGGVAYELLRKYPFVAEIVGVDDRARFVGLANQMAQNHQLEYAMRNEFGKEEDHRITLQDLKMETLLFNKIRFVHDTDLKITMDGNEDNKYDLIVGENMLARYYNVLRENEYTLDRLLTKNGVIILFEDYDWNKDGLNVREVMQAILGKSMIMKQELNTVPITRRVYKSSRIKTQISFHCTVWIKA